MSFNNKSSLRTIPIHGYKNDEVSKLLNERSCQQTNYDQWMRAPRTTINAPSQVSVCKKVSSASTCVSREPEYRGESVKSGSTEKSPKERVKMLGLRILTGRKTLEEYKFREKELIQMNGDLIAEVDSMDSDTSFSARNLLMTYEKYRVGLGNLDEMFNDQKIDATETLKNVRDNLTSKLAGMERWVDDYDNLVSLQHRKLYNLQCYKDKEYHVKVMLIADLEKTSRELYSANEDDYEEWQLIMEQQMKRFESDLKERSMSIHESLSGKVLKLIHPSIHEMMLQNISMRKEIMTHEKKQAAMKKKITQLRKEVTKLKGNPSNNFRACVFPEISCLPKKCTPDMDVVLDIPTQQWLPI